MILDKCKKIININIEQFKEINSEVQKNFLEMFPCYNSTPEYISQYNFTEAQDNPNPKNFRDDTIYIHHIAEYGANYQCKNITHANFNFEAVIFNNNLYLFQGVYYFSHYVSNELYKLFQYYLSGPFKVGDRLKYDYLTYKQWVDNHSDQKFAQHNYKIDQEDLAKIGIIV